MRLKKPSFQAKDDNIFWITMSDLLLGLLVVFIVLFMFTITGFSQNRLQEKRIQYQLGENLSNELSSKNINVEIDKISGKVKISDLELFELNKWELSAKGKAFLNKFIPVYLNSILGNAEIKGHVSQIIIEGHTDSQGFANSRNKEDNYIKNMDLSLKRAYAVAKYIIDNDFSNKKLYKNDLIKLMSVNGKSFTEPVLVNNKEDFKRSRRVELKVQFKDYNIQDFISRK